MTDVPVSTLHNPDFWRALLAKVPPLDTETEEQTLAALATRTGLSTAKVKELKRAYLRGCVAVDRGEAHPGNDAIH